MMVSHNFGLPKSLPTKQASKIHGFQALFIGFYQRRSPLFFKRNEAAMTYWL